MVKLEYEDSRGFRRRVIVPSSYDKPEMGIPIDIYDLLDEYLAEIPELIRVELYKQLWRRHLIEMHDFMNMTSGKRMRESLIATFNMSAVNIIQYIKENAKDV